MFLSYTLSDDVSLSKTTSPALHRLLLYRTPPPEDILHKSANTTRAWILSAFTQSKSKAAIRRELAATASRITLSFDGWKSGNKLTMPGTIAHCIDKDYHVTNVLHTLQSPCCTEDMTDPFALTNVSGDWRMGVQWTRTALMSAIMGNSTSND